MLSKITEGVAKVYQKEKIVTELNISQAAVVSGVSRATIQRKIKSGEMSARTEGQEKLIDTSELIRVFGQLKVQLPVADVQVATPAQEDALKQQISALQDEIKFLRKQIEKYEEKEERLMSMLEKEQDKTQRLLEGPKKSSFLTKIFQKNS